MTLFRRITDKRGQTRLSSKQVGLGVVGFFPGGGGGREEGFLVAGGDGVAGFEVAEQERGLRIVVSEILERLARVLVGVAVFAAVEAGVVRADVVRFDAAAARADALVLELAEGHAVGVAEDVERHAPGGMDAEA